MRLKSVSIFGFRSVAAVEDLSMGKPTLLTGGNDAGKTAILDAVRFLLGDYTLTERDPTFVGKADGGLDSTQRVDEIAVTGQFELSADEQSELSLPATLQLRRRADGAASVTYEVEVTLPSDERLRDLEAKRLQDLKDLVLAFGVATSATDKAGYLADLRAFADTTDQVVTWVAAPPGVIRALPPVERFNPSGSQDANDAIKKVLDTAFRGHIASDDHRSSIQDLETAISTKLVADAADIRDHIMRRCPDIGDVQIVPVVSFNEGLRATQVTVKARDGDGGVGLQEAGAGRARRISLAVWEKSTDLLARAGDVVMIYDEPDTHLDYSHQREFMEIIRSQCALENITMLIATHSMNLIDGIDIADVVHVSHDGDNRTQIDVLADDSEIGKHLGAIAAALGLRNTVLLHERLFVGVEGLTEMACFPVLFRTSTGRQLESAGVALWDCRNNEGAVDFAEFLIKHRRDVVFIVDEDSRHNAKHVFSDVKLAKRGMAPTRHAIYVGEPMELEELFGDDLWVRVATKVWPRTDGREWNTGDFAAHRGSTSKFSSAVLDMTRVASDEGPSNKPDVMIEMALSITDPAEVPLALNVIFAELVKRAS